MSDYTHADEASNMLDRVEKLADGDDEHTRHYQLGYLLGGALVHALLDVAHALRKPE